MPTPRSQQISLLDTQFYHICSRTVRKAFLCGVKTYQATHNKFAVKVELYSLSFSNKKLLCILPLE
jgi:hypothetical protein